MDMSESMIYESIKTQPLSQRDSIDTHKIFAK